MNKVIFLSLNKSRQLNAKVRHYYEYSSNLFDTNEHKALKRITHLNTSAESTNLSALTTNQVCDLFLRCLPDETFYYKRKKKEKREEFQKYNPFQSVSYI